ncbi:MAG: LytTR family transcriptional regulator DNA-binding domain-containing protein [Bacilli bacterium]
MLEIIICDDNDIYVDKVIEVIDDYLLKEKIEYKISKFNDYNQVFYDATYLNNKNKIYILDIETPTGSGIEAARKIRSRDLKSHIIMLTSHEKSAEEILTLDLFITSFITKNKDTKNRLENVLNYIIKNDIKNDVVEIITKSTNYYFRQQSVLYISRENVSRKTEIVTDNGTYEISKTLIEVRRYFDENFVQTHKSGFVNLKRIVAINKKKKSIKFDTGLEVDLLSLKYKKELDILCHSQQ